VGGLQNKPGKSVFLPNRHQKRGGGEEQRPLWEGPPVRIKKLPCTYPRVEAKKPTEKTLEERRRPHPRKKGSSTSKPPVITAR